MNEKQAVQAAREALMMLITEADAGSPSAKATVGDLGGVDRLRAAVQVLVEMQVRESGSLVPTEAQRAEPAFLRDMPPGPDPDAGRGLTLTEKWLALDLAQREQRMLNGGPAAPGLTAQDRVDFERWMERVDRPEFEEWMERAERGLGVERVWWPANTTSTPAPGVRCACSLTATAGGATRPSTGWSASPAPRPTWSAPPGCTRTWARPSERATCDAGATDPRGKPSRAPTRGRPSPRSSSADSINTNTRGVRCTGHGKTPKERHPPSAAG